jgi:REP element-mobilizing transposase RayT
MANTYTQLNIHAVFAVKGRENLLRDDFRSELFRYMQGIITGIGLYPLAVNGYHDHVHVFFELNTTLSVAKALQQIKANSARWINDRSMTPKRFNWQSGYSAFSNSRSQRDRVIKYITNQEQHHVHESFRKEYLAFLENFQVQHDSRYLFEFYD